MEPRNAEVLNLDETPRNRIKRFLGNFPTSYRLVKRLELVVRRFTLTVHEDEFRAFKPLRNDHGLIIDVGANTGQSAVSLRNALPKMRILSFEINPALQQELEFVRRLVPNFEFRMEGLAGMKGEATFFLPESDQIDLSQEGSLSPSFLAERLRSFNPRVVGSVSIRKISVPLRPFDDFNLDPAIVKIDVQGAELEVLRGMASTLERCNPTLLIENNDPEVLKFLRDVGYRSFSWRSNRLVVPVPGGNIIAIHRWSKHLPRLGISSTESS